MNVKLEYGTKEMDITVSEEKIMGLLTGPEIPAMSFDEVSAIIREGIKKHTPAGTENKKIVIITPDNTRLWARGDLYVPVILDTLKLIGVPEKNIKIVIALGTHSDQGSLLHASLVGDGTADRVEILNSANKDISRLTYKGKTVHGTELYITKEADETDHVIIFGGILHHIIAGFGGGRKYISTGIAGYDSIQQNHSLAMLSDGKPHPKVCQANLEGNPVHEDMASAAEVFLKNKTSTLVAVAANGNGEIFWAGTGDYKEQFLKGCDQVNRAGSVLVKELGDFAIISAGGYRKDGQLYQSTKALFNTYPALQEGAEILFFAECREGVGSEIFEKLLIQYKGNTGALGGQLLKHFNMDTYVAYRVIDILARYRVTLISSFSKDVTENLGFHYTERIDNYIKNLKGRGYIIPSAENILPIIEK
jgi:nickel-dependent lactate racemase